MFGAKRILGRAASPSRGMAFMVMPVVAVMLSACGQRGPLYLPPPPQPAAEKPADTSVRSVPTAPGQR